MVDPEGPVLFFGCCLTWRLQLFYIRNNLKSPAMYHYTLLQLAVGYFSTHSSGIIFLPDCQPQLDQRPGHNCPLLIRRIILPIFAFMYLFSPAAPPVTLLLTDNLLIYSVCFQHLTSLFLVLLQLVYTHCQFAICTAVALHETDA